MRTIVIFLKGILFYVAIFMSVLFLISIDSLNATDIFMQLIVITILFYSCKKIEITKEELDIISGTKLMDKLLKSRK